MDERNQTPPIGRSIASLRRLRGYKQGEMARELGVSQSTLSDIESEKQIPSLLLTIRIARVFDLSLDALVFGTWSSVSPHVSKVRATGDSERSAAA